MKQKTILVVDDEKDIVKILQERLLANDYKVLIAFGGEEALVKAKSFHPDLIILDIMMPDLSGTTVAEKLKENRETKNIPIIFLTCLVEKEEEKESKHIIGNNLFFAKPFDTEELVKTVGNILNPSQG